MSERWRILEGDAVDVLQGLPKDRIPNIYGSDRFCVAVGLQEIDWAYIAGLFDGEAYIGIKKQKAGHREDMQSPGYHARIQVRMVDKAALQMLKDAFGGSFYQEGPHAENGRPLWCWGATDRMAEEILRGVRPHLKIKGSVTDTVLELRDLQAQGPKHRTKVVGTRTFPGPHGNTRTVKTKVYSDEYLQWCEDLYVEAKKHNRTGADPGPTGGETDGR